MKSFKKIMIPVTASAVLLGACGNHATDSKEDVIISSKAGDVKVEDVMKKIGTDQIANSSFEILLGKLLEKKYADKVDTKDIDKQIKEEQKQYGGKSQFESALKQQGMSLDDYKEQKKLQAYQKQLLLDKVKVSDKELKEDTKKASHILIKVKSDDKDKEGLSDKEAKQKAEKIQKEVKKNPDKFGEIAKKESMDNGSAKNDGSLGFVIKGQMVEPFDKALFKLKEGDISDVIKTDYGYHIIKVDKPTDFSSERNKLKSQIIQNKIQKDPQILVDAYKDLLKEYKVDFKDRDIKKAVDNSILDADKLKQQSQSGGSGKDSSGEGISTP